MPAATGVPSRLGAASLLVVVLLGLSAHPTRSQGETDTDTSPDFSPCSQCFYQEEPPQGVAGAGLSSQCHRLQGAAQFACLYNPSCAACVYTALRLTQKSHWGSQEAQVETEEDVTSQADPQIRVPALLGGDGWQSKGHSASAPALSSWDALISALVRQAAVPLCSGASTLAEGADLFVLTGAAGLEVGDGGEEEGCKVGVLWSAVCCVSPGEGSEADRGGDEEHQGFSLGVVKGSGEEERVVSLQELLEATGLTSVFNGFCGSAGSDSDVMETFLQTLEALRKDMGTKETNDTEEQSRAVREGGDSRGTDTPGMSEEDVTSLDAEAQSRAAVLAEDLEEENETQGSGSFMGRTLMYLLSTSVSLLCAPFHPVFSTLTSLPGQVTYILGEDLAVLSSIPMGAVSLFNNIVCDLCGGVSSAVGLVAGVGQLGISTVYACTAPLVGGLLGAFYDGLAGLGLLGMDTLGIFRGVVDSAWSLSKFFGGTVWEHSEGYVGSVLSELGHQVKIGGLGVGKLLWRSGRGLGNVVGAVSGLAGGTIASVVENVQEAFGGE